MKTAQPTKVEAVKRDLYEVLGLPRDAAQHEIKSAYKKAALKHHPDKNTGAGASQAATQFQEISAAYIVLSDPSKKARYDAKGFSGLEPSELDAELDVSSLGLVGTVAAAMFSRLGVPIKTSIAAGVLEEAYEGRFRAEQLQFDRSLPGKAEKAQAAFFELAVPQAQIDAGFLIGVSSPVGSKFKLLLFEQQHSGTAWELQAQEESLKTRHGTSLAAFFFMDAETHSVGPKPVLEAAKEPAAQLFLRLESIAPRERIPIKPGRLLMAVYNDNWFKRAQFSISAVTTGGSQTVIGAVSELQEVEKKLLEQRTAIRAFETEYKKAQEQWRKACEEFSMLSADVEKSLGRREDIYLRLTAGEQSDKLSQPPALFQGWQALRRSKN